MNPQPSIHPPIQPSLAAFEFATAARILFGTGKLSEAAPLAKSFGRQALVVIGDTAAALQRVEPLLSALTGQGVDYATFSVAGEPTIEIVRHGVRHAREERSDVILGFGGGSVLDAGKAIAALLANEGDPLDYVEVIGRGRPLTKPSLPYIAIPTTAGTGTEVTRNAVLGSPEHRVKVSLRSPLLLPRVALVDPELTYDLPPAITASTGLDALTQLIEPFVSGRANPLTDAICREGIGRAARSLRHAFNHGDDPAARADMALASLCGGLALANAGLGAVHGFAAPIGGMFPAPHGAVCARLLPVVMEMNVRVGERSRRSATLQRYAEIAQIVTGNADATAGDGVAWVRDLGAALSIQPLRAYGMREEDFPALIEKASAASSMKGNPVPLTPGEMREILAQAL